MHQRWPVVEVTVGSNITGVIIGVITVWRYFAGFCA